MTHASTEQPEALHYAEVLDNFYMGLSRLDATGVAAVLRTQHARILELEASHAQRVPLSDARIEAAAKAAGMKPIHDKPKRPVKNALGTSVPFRWIKDFAHGITQEKQG